MRRGAALAAATLSLLAAAATPPPSERDAPAVVAPLPYATAETPLGTLLDDPAARAAIARHAPSIVADPDAPQARELTLADMQAFAPTVLTGEALARIDADFARLPPSRAAVDRAAGVNAAIASARIDAAEPWITHPAAYAADHGRAPVSLQFRRALALRTRPASLKVAVSADNRFVLYVNGARVAAGPARGDLAHWRYAIVDLAPHLHAGRNVIAAQVWSDGRFAPVAQITAGRTGLMLRTLDPAAPRLDAGADWQVRVDRSRSVSSGMKQVIGAVGPSYYAAGGPERIAAADQLPGWTTGPGGGDWTAAVPALRPAGRPRRLVPDALPPMRYDAVPSGRVVRATGIDAGGFPARPLVVPPRSRATMLIDAGQVLAAYPSLRVSGGAGSSVSLTYTEALYDPAPGAGGGRTSPRRFADRARVADGVALGLRDTFLPDGGADRTLAPYWWRAWRFVEVAVTTGDSPLTLDGFDTYATGYPFEARGWFNSDDAELNAIWRIGWRTAQVDAHETYMDTAYWEQLQYVGDTRIQALLSYDVAGDGRLAVQALDAFDGSRVVDGLPQSSWPISGSNPIPPFALLWIGMLHDHWMRRPDVAVLRRTLPGMRSVLDWYAPYVRDTGIVRASPGWLFVDWREGLDGGRDRAGRSADSCVISLLYVGALREAADLERAVGDPARATADDASGARSAAGIRSTCWNADRRLFTDTPGGNTYSQHANALAVLYDVAPRAEQQAILRRIVVPGHGIDPPAGMTGATYYFAFYLARALDHAGMADSYLGLLSTWRGLLRQNFTTWPENPDPTRSDSHAWSAHPTGGLLNHVAGIQPDAPGFARVRIAPHLGPLRRLDAGMAHPNGVIAARYRVANGTLTAAIALPRGLRGVFVWQDRRHALRPGTNRLRLPMPHEGARP